jgi:hypothetical protein
LKPSFTISGWYYSCATTQYTAFCKQESLPGLAEATWVCLEVDADSSFIISLMLSGVETQYKVAGMKALSGWTWFAITLQEIYGNTILTFYSGHDNYIAPFVAADFIVKVETVTLAGFYTDPLPSAKPQLKLYLGCRRNSDLICYRPMIGYFYQLKIWDSLALSSAQL